MTCNIHTMCTISKGLREIYIPVATSKCLRTILLISCKVFHALTLVHTHFIHKASVTFSSL